MEEAGSQLKSIGVLLGGVIGRLSIETVKALLLSQWGLVHAGPLLAEH